MPGFDDIAGGGLPRGHASLITGGPGSGKTIFALQSLICGAAADDEASVFVCFEEHPERIVEHAAGFGWDADAAPVHFLDARLDSSVVQSGDFDLLGLLASAQAAAAESGAERIVLDGIDVVLDLLDEPRARRRELLRLREWLEARNVTTTITAKVDPASGALAPGYAFLEFLCDAVVELQHQSVGDTAVRTLRISKQRGSAHASHECPFVIGSDGIEVADLAVGPLEYPVSEERVSTGVERLDGMLGGGYYRGSSVIVSGAPGTAKTTLGGAFAAAACQRGEGTLLVSFDEAAEQIVRNLASVGIELAPLIESGRLEIHAARSRPRNPQEHLLDIRRRWTELGARCLVIDPISALTSSRTDIAEEIALHLVDLARRDSVTVLATALTSQRSRDVEATPIGLSTAADTWIHLSYVPQAGERNRALTVVKSRGMSHSNQVRELLLHDEGLTLTDVYVSGGEVLMGTMRWEKEAAERAEQARREHAQERQIRETETRLARARSELEALREEVDLETQDLERLRERAASQRESRETTRERIRDLRRADEDND